MGGLFFLFWIILNGRVTTEIVIFGLVISRFLYAFSWKFVGYKPYHEVLFLKNLPLVIEYLLVLVKAGLIFVSAILYIGACRNESADRIKIQYSLLSLVIFIYEILLLPATIFYIALSVILVGAAVRMMIVWPGVIIKKKKKL